MRSSILNVGVGYLVWGVEPILALYRISPAPKSLISYAFIGWSAPKVKAKIGFADWILSMIPPHPQWLTINFTCGWDNISGYGYQALIR